MLEKQSRLFLRLLLLRCLIPIGKYRSVPAASVFTAFITQHYGTEANTELARSRGEIIKHMIAVVSRFEVGFLCCCFFRSPLHTYTVSHVGRHVPPRASDLT